MPAMSAAISARAAASIRNSRSSPGRRAGSAGRSNGPCDRQECISQPTTRPAISRSRPSWRSTPTANSWRCAARTSVNHGAYAALLRPLDQGRRDHVEHLPRAGGAFPRPRRADQHRADPPLSQPGPARGHVRHGAADRSRGARSTGFDRVELRRRNLVPATAMPYTNPFGMVYDSGDYHGVMEHVLALADWDGLPGAPRRGASARQMPRHRRRATTSTPRPARRASGPRSRCCPRRASSRSSSAQCRAARATKPASRS